MAAWRVRVGTPLAAHRYLPLPAHHYLPAHHCPRPLHSHPTRLSCSVPTCHSPAVSAQSHATLHSLCTPHSPSSLLLLCSPSWPRAHHASRRLSSHASLHSPSAGAATSAALQPLARLPSGNASLAARRLRPVPSTAARPAMLRPPARRTTRTRRRTRRTASSPPTPFVRSLHLPRPSLLPPPLTQTTTACSIRTSVGPAAGRHGLAVAAAGHNIDTVTIGAAWKAEHTATVPAHQPPCAVFARGRIHDCAHLSAHSASTVRPLTRWC